MPQGRVSAGGIGPAALAVRRAATSCAGGTIDAILDTTPRRNVVRALPHLPGFLLSPYIAKGLALLSQRAAQGAHGARRDAPRRCRRGQSARGELSPPAGARNAFLSTISSCTRASCRTSISPCRSASSTAGTRCSSAGRPSSTSLAPRRFQASHGRRRRRHRRCMRRRGARPARGPACRRRSRRRARRSGRCCPVSSTCARPCAGTDRVAPFSTPSTSRRRSSACPQDDEHHRVPLRGGHRRPDPRHRQARLSRAPTR